MAETDRPQSPFAGMVDFSARTPLRVLSPDEIEQMLAEHRLYLETEYHQGHRANFASADLTGRDFSGLNLRGIKMDRAVLRGADFTGAHLQSANLVGALAEQACFYRSALLYRACWTEVDGPSGAGVGGRVSRGGIMSATGLDVFAKTLQTTNIWLDEIMAAIGPNRQLAWHVLGATLRELRDRLPLEEASHFGAQLPVLIRGVY